MMNEQFIVSARNPMVSNHRVYGQALLPGLAYIDILYQVFRKHGYRFDRLELRHLTIYKPLIAGHDHAVMLGIHCEERSERSWSIRLEARNQRDGVIESGTTLYATAEMCLIDPVTFDETLDINAMKRSASARIGLHEVYEQYRKQELVHTGYMKASGTIYKTDGEMVLEVALGDEALPGSEQFMFHPVLIDGSGVGSGGLLAQAAPDEDRLFLPLYYESFSASELLQDRCVTRVRNDAVLRKNELMQWTMEFFNGNGRKVAELKNFAGKLVREAGLINPEWGAAGHIGKQQQDSPVQPSFAYSNIGSPPAGRVQPESMERFLQQLMADLLNRPADEIDPQAGYYEMGLDSPGLLGLVRAIESGLKTTLSPTLLFEYTTIAELADYLRQHHGESFSQLAANQQNALRREGAAASVESGSAAASAQMTARKPVSTSGQGDVAIIGMSGRYPGARNMGEFWSNLLEGKDCISEVPVSRWHRARMEGIKSPSGKEMSRWGGFIDDPDRFDPKFFRISPREAETMDPQERLFLETCWETIEDAGYTPKTLVAPRGRSNRRKVGVFAGVMHKDYTLIGAEAVSQGQPIPLSLTSGPIANRVSYFCNFHGPSMTLDTLCSSSLTAVHLAIESIKRGECEVALAGGVNLSLHPAKYMTYGMWGMHASGGYCNTFGKDGDGYVSAEGAAAVLLKPLDKAIEDQDRIYAVIKGSAINHGGAVSGIMVPSPVAQGEVIAACLAEAGIDPRTISYVEAHGTGTSLGDPIEIDGLIKAFGSFTQDWQFCAIGSVKSNIGHAESAAGVIGLQKAALQLYHRTLVPSLHAEELNPHIDFAQSPFYVQRTAEPWEQPTMADEDGRQAAIPRRAGLSSFGATGSNAHLVLEEYVEPRRPALAQRTGRGTALSAVIPLSARNKERLKDYAGKLLAFLQKLPANNRSRSQEDGRAVSEMVQNKIRRMLAGIIHVKEEAIEMGVEWADYGIEPVHIRQLKETIREQLLIEMDMAEFVHRDSIAALADYLIECHFDALDAYREAAAIPEIAGTEQTDPNGKETTLADIAYTLQVGREAMEERAAWVVRDIPELIRELESYLHNRDESARCYTGRVKSIADESSVPSLAANGSAAIPFMDGEHMDKLAELWVRGTEVDWGLLYGELKPRRVGLPTYPFARDRFWIPDSGAGLSASAASASAAAAEAAIHPMLHRNTSDFSGQRFSTAFTGSEFFLADHLVKGQRILPGVAYLEMARIAVQQSAAVDRKGDGGIRLKNIVWIRPIAAGERPAAVHIRLKPEENGGISYEIYTAPQEDGAEPIVHSKGSARLAAAAAAAEQVLDIGSIKSRCSEASLSASQFYETFKALGMDYGPSHRGIVEVHRGAGMLLAKLSLPAQVSGTLDQYVLHPSLMDSALQTTIGFQLNAGERVTALPKPVMPFALQELEVWGACKSSMWAWVRSSESSGAADQTMKFDIDLCDDQGAVCVRIKGFSTRAVEGELQTALPPAPSRSESAGGTPVGNIILHPVWDTVHPALNETFPAAADRILIAGGNESRSAALRKAYPHADWFEHRPGDTVEQIADRLQAYGRIDHMVWIAPESPLRSVSDDAVIKEQESGVIACFRMAKALIELGYGSRKLGWTVITFNTQAADAKEEVNPVHASVHGLAGSMAKEYPGWTMRVIDMEAGCEWPLEQMFALPADRRGSPWVYRSREWYRQQLIPVEAPSNTETMYRRHGVYVVIGGAGGIGKAWSEYMVRTYKAQIIWIGRRPMDAGIRSELSTIAAFGPEPRYISADAADVNALQEAYLEIKRQYTAINGIVHSAMVLSDTALADMEENHFRAGLSAKIDVSVRMAQVFREEPLDFVLFFSSLISFIKNAKQSHYASGSAFKDAFAHRLSGEWPCKVKIMNWGYWSSDDAAASDDVQQLARIGMGLIEPADGMDALELLVSGPADQLAMVTTTKPLIIEGMNPQERIELRPASSAPVQAPLIRKRIPDRSAQIQSMKRGMSRHKALDDLLARILLGELSSLGVFRTNISPAAAGKAQNGIAAMYGRWLDQSIQVLEQSGLLDRDGENDYAADAASADRDAAWQEWERNKAAWLDDPSLRAWTLLAEAALRSLPDVLTGRKPATDILFPNSSMRLVEGIYKNNPAADYFNEVLVDTLLAYIEERLADDPHAKLRIIEIGAGTGGTSSLLFRKLQPYREQIEEYCYTDISKAFLHFAEKEYGAGNPYLTYKMYNVENPSFGGPSAPSGLFDIAVATNVLHATRNIRQTMRNAKALLKHNGIVLINELSQPGLLTHLTFGLLEGWWLYEDAALRIPGCPGLYPAAWQAVLEAEGFGPVLFPAQEAHELGQQIIAAGSDGIVRRKHAGQAVAANARDTGRAAQETSGGTSFSPHYEQVKPPKPGIGQEAVQPRVEAASDTVMTEQLLDDFVKETIAEKLSEALKVERGDLDADESFADYGLDSIIGVHLVQVLNQALSIELDTTSLFDYSSINRLAAYILSDHRDGVAAAFKPLAKNAPAPSAMPAPAAGGIGVQQSGFDMPDERKEESDASASGERIAPMGKEPIAIIGMSGRFAKSSSVDELWTHLSEGSELIEKAQRWELSDYYPKDAEFCDRGGFVDDIDKFDPFFFNINGLEASYMDPQQRLFMEEGWRALEDAGYAGARVQGRQCGVYVGCLGGAGDYSQLAGGDAPPQAFWGSAGSVIPARIAYYLDLKGPAIAVDTACSSSLVAVHLACQGLWAGETEMALAGGVFIQSTPWYYLRTNKAGMLSKAGHSYTFDDRADGFVPGEGVGAVVLKRLADAVADGDHIYGVLRGSGVNQDGTTNGITAPSAISQEKLESSVYGSFGIDPGRIQMVEAHGTGTKLGDPIEYQALTRAFRKYTDKTAYCALGSIKTNIGHAAHAAGVAGIIKILLSMKHKQIPASLNFETGNPNIPFEGSPFYVNTKLRDWDAEPNGKRLAAVSSFGFSGTNAHLVIEEAPEPTRRHDPKPGYLIVLSARTPEQLRQQANQLIEYVRRNRHSDCGNMSYTLLLGRKHFNSRLACIVRDADELSSLLGQWLKGGKAPQLFASEQYDNDRPEQLALKRYGNECIRECSGITQPGEYIERLTIAAELYVQGYALEFEPIFAAGQYAIVSLPTYPFADERYWVPENSEVQESVRRTGTAEPIAAIHPLLHRNTSDLTGVRFSSSLAGSEYVRSSYAENGLSILPGVAYLEMARAAVKTSGGAIWEGRSGIRLKDVVWASPVPIGENEVHIELYPDAEGQISYEIYSQRDPSGNETIIHNQGTAAFIAADEAAAATADWADMRSRSGLIRYTREEWYRSFERNGFAVHPEHQGVEELFVLDGQVLAKLALPASARNVDSRFILHPWLTDSALQAAAALTLTEKDGSSSETFQPAAPLALQELVISGAANGQIWALIAYSGGYRREDNNKRLDIDFYDGNGCRFAAMKGLTTRVELPAGKGLSFSTI